MTASPLQVAITGALLFWGQAAAAAPDPFAAARHKMVDDHIVSAGIDNQRVLDAMRSTPRHEFLRPRQWRIAYYDMAIPIGHGQTISPPYVVAFMTANLDPQPTDRVLEIGTGSGYQAAVLSPLVKDVYTIEIVEPLGKQAAKTLKRLKYKNVHPKIGDGFAGWPEAAPFDKIIVTCSPENIPQPLIDQLAEGGQMVIPVGERFQQTLCRFQKQGGQLKQETLQATFFVPMTGAAEDRRQVIDDPSSPTLVHGSFEEKSDTGDSPTGWYYVREGKVQSDSTAPDGERVMEFSNMIPGRSAHALQAFGVDGLLVRQIELAVSARGSVLPGPDRSHQAHLVVEFYGENRSPVGHAVIGPWTGDFEWRRESKKITVPPTARLAVVGVGLFGATGNLAVDSVSVVGVDDRKRRRK